MSPTLKIVPQDMSPEDMRAEMEKLMAENAKLKSDSTKGQTGELTCKVSAKGAVCIYGLGRFPITLYISQFDRLNKNWAKVQEFVEQHRTEFSTEKPAKASAKDPAPEASAKAQLVDEITEDQVAS